MNEELQKRIAATIKILLQRVEVAGTEPVAAQIISEAVLNLTNAFQILDE